MRLGKGLNTYNIHTGGQRIETVEEFNYLVVSIDRSGNYNNIMGRCDHQTISSNK